MKFLKILFFLICVFAAVNVHAQSSDELKKQRDKINNELDQLNHELQETQNNKKTTLKQLNNLKAQINLREQKITVINKEVKNLDDQISDNTNTVHTLQNELDLLKREYASMILFADRNKSAYNKLMFIFASKDFNQAYKRLKYLQQFASYRERQANHIQSTQKDLNVKIVELDKTKEQKHTLLVDQEKEKATLGKQKSSQQSVVSDLSSKEKQLMMQRQAKQREVTRIVREYTNQLLIEERHKLDEANKLAAKTGNKNATLANKPAARKTDSELLNSTPEAAKLSNDFLGNRGRLPWPVAHGVIVQGFGPYVIQGGIRDQNYGVDIKTNPNEPVRAVFDGTVTRVLDFMGSTMLIIRHGEYLTVYSNLKSHAVSENQKVSYKQIVGVVGTDSFSGDAILQFQITKAGIPVDPKPWLASGGS